MESDDFLAPRPLAGAFCITAAGAMFSVMGVLIKKAAAAGMTNEMVVFSRTLFVFIIMLPQAWAIRGRVSMKTRRPGVHLIRSVSGLLAMYCYFYALSRMPLAEAVLLSYTSPLFIPMVAFFWLGEPLLGRFIIAVAVGFLGVICIMKPGAGMMQGAAWAGLMAGALASVAMVSIRRLSSTEPPFRIVFYYTLISSVVSAVPLIWGWVTPDPATWGILAATGAVAYCGQMLVTMGYSFAPASQLGPFTYTTVVFAGVMGWLFWGEAPEPWSVFGACLVFCAGMITTRKK